jgi:RecA-family ATPase
MVSDKPLPRNINAEIRFARSLLTSDCCKMILVYANKIRPEFFSDSGCRKVYEITLKMQSAGESISLETFDNWMQRENLPEVEISAIDEVITSGDVTINLEPDSKEILRYHSRRNAIVKTQRMQNLLFDTSIEYSGLLPQIREISDSLVSGNSFNKWSIADLSPDRFFTAEPEPVQWIIENVLAKGLVGFIYGEGGSFKSLAALWLVLQMSCVNINSTQKWLDKFPVLFGRSIFFSAEDVFYDLHDRVRKITPLVNVERPDIPESAIGEEISKNCLIITREQWTDDRELFIVDENGTETFKLHKIISLITEFNADLIILETYSRIFNVDEIDNRQAVRAVAALERIRDQTGATVLCIAHSSKASRTTQSDIHGQNGLRGAGALMDNARFGMWFKAQKSENGINQIEIVNSKNFRCKRFDKFTVSVSFPEFKIMDKPIIQEDVIETVYNYISKNQGTTQRTAIKEIGGNAKELNAAFKKLTDDNEIEQRTMNKKKGYYLVSKDEK